MSSSISLHSSCGSTFSLHSSCGPTFSLHSSCGSTFSSQGSTNARTWSTNSSELDDGYQWSKYGQRPFPNFDCPRNYFRCIHKSDQGCLALKHVQRIQKDAPWYQTTYYNHHTCNIEGSFNNSVISGAATANSRNYSGDEQVQYHDPMVRYLQCEEEYREEDLVIRPINNPDPEMGKDLSLCCLPSYPSISSHLAATVSNSLPNSQTSCPSQTSSPSVDFVNDVFCFHP